MNGSFDSVRRSLIDRVRELVGKLMWAPVDIVAIAHDLGVVAIEPRTMAVDGYLARRSDGKFDIRYKDGSDDKRTRFTIAHEVGHILHFQIAGIEVDHQVARGPGRCDDIERLANLAAAELLMPAHLVADFLKKRGVSWPNLWELADRLNVSNSAAIRRIREVPHIFAIEMRLNIETSDPAKSRISIWHSPSKAFYLRRSPVRLAEHFLCEMQTQNVHRLPASLDGHDFEMKCIGRSIPGDNRADGAYQIIGWVPLSTRQK